MTINHRIDALRAKMSEHQIDAVIIPTADAHQSEYVPSCWADREWISGFTGSAGISIISMEEATIWTDGRYFIQAEQEISDSYFILKKQIARHEPEHLLWMLDQLEEGMTIGINTWNFTKGQVKQIKKYASKKSIEVNDIDLISMIWSDRPSKSDNPIFEFDIKYHGQSTEDKIDQVRSKMNELEAEHYVITALDEIAWLFNLRGSDVDFNPIFIAYAMVSKDRAMLFVDESKFENGVKESLNKADVIVKGYETIQDLVAEIPVSQSVLVDPTIINDKLYQRINGKIVEAPSIVQAAKGVKNETEINQWKEAMIQDAVALAHAFYWLEKEIENRPVTEVEFGQKIMESRSKRPGYKGESFPPIVGYKGNGAVLHYNAKEATCKTMTNEGMLLCDSGGQYINGTTDITRTITFSAPTKEMKKHFTLVLKGMIGLTRAVFPEGTTGGQLDLLARQHLWAEGLDFPHGTGHGVGFYMNVHEGPHGFASIGTSRGKFPIKAGMVTSNEPGYYIVDQYGIRLENLVLAIPAQYKGYLKFETLTLFPFDQDLIDETDMNAAEKAWFNQYHNKVYELVSPHLEGELKSWMKRKCKPLN